MFLEVCKCASLKAGKIVEANTLYYGDNLDILSRYIPDESVDLIYLDPPFKSDQDYNVLFEERDGTEAMAQMQAFKDTWTWDQKAAETYEAVVEAGGQLSFTMQAFKKMLGSCDMLAYLAMMAPRLVDLRRVLKPEGSIYLHCDPTASHLLRLLLDAVFGKKNFKNEIIWKRTSAHKALKKYSQIHDVIFFYTKSKKHIWTDAKAKHDEIYVKKFYTKYERKTDRYFQPIDLTGPGKTLGDSGKPWRGFNPSSVGRHWAIPEIILKNIGLEEGTSQEKLDALDEAGLIFWPKKEGGKPRLKWYQDQLIGTSLSDVWNDIHPISAHAQERLGYPTQKPEKLLERIIEASSEKGDVVLDPFCGCGTTIAVAQRMNRRWIGIDITHLAITLIKNRLAFTYGDDIKYKVIGEPVSVADAETLARQDRYQFQWWALGLVGARPVEEKKGADKGIDGRLFFHDDNNGKTKQIIFSVKSGSLSVQYVRDLRGVIEREAAEIGVLLTFEAPTKRMITEATEAGLYQSPWGKHPRMQILTISELLQGKRVDYPPSKQVNVTYRRAKRRYIKSGGNSSTLI